MGNLLSKLCKAISYPLKVYEYKKTKEVYDELFTDEFDADLEEDRRKFLKEKLELVLNLVICSCYPPSS